MSHHLTTNQVQHVATLANIPISENEAQKLVTAFDETLEVVEQLQSIDVTGVDITSQVTGLENVLREDEINEAKMFTQSEALAGASHTHDGYFVVPQIIEQDS